MSEDRLTKDGYADLVAYLEAHWPTGRKWSDPASVYPTLAYYGDDLLMSAARQAVNEGDEFMPGPVDLVRRAKAILRKRADERQRERGVGADHPSGHVWLVLPDVVADVADGMRRAVCAICGEEQIGSTTKLRTVGEADRARQRSG